MLTHLQSATQVRADVIGWIMTAKGLGMLLGSPLSGVVFNTFKKNDEEIFKWYHLSLNRLLLIYLFFMALVVCVVPFLRNFWLVMLVYALQGWFTAAIEIGCNLGIGWVWRENVAPFLQMLHCASSAGSLVFPLIIAQFFTYVSDEKVQFLASFILCGVFIIIGFPGLLLIQSPKEAVCCGVLRLKQKKVDELGLKMFFRDPKSCTLRLWEYLLSWDTLLYTLAGYLKGCVTGAYSTFGNFVFQYGQGRDFGSDVMLAYLTTVFWLCFTLGRFVSIFLSAFLRPFPFLATSVGVSLMAYSFILMLNNVNGLWIGTILHGLFSAPVSGLAIAVPQTFGINLNPLSTSIVMVGSTLGETVIPTMVNLFRPLGVDSIVIVLFVLFITAYLDVFAIFILGRLLLFFRNSKNAAKAGVSRGRKLWRSIKSLEFFY